MRAKQSITSHMQENLQAIIVSSKNYQKEKIPGDRFWSITLQFVAFFQAEQGTVKDAIAEANTELANPQVIFL